MSEQPLLSIVTTGRNDGYMGNFTYRMATMIKSWQRSAAVMGRISDIEIVVVDWGSEPKEALEGALWIDDTRSLRFLRVPEAVAKQYDGKSPFSNAHALNVGIRRAKGVFIAQAEADCIYRMLFIDRLTGFLLALSNEKNPTEKFWFVARTVMPYRMASASPPDDVLAWLLDHAADCFPHDRFYVQNFLGQMTPTSMMIAHRDIWHACQGFDENLIHWGWLENDLALRLTKVHQLNWLDTPRWPVPIHMEHYPNGDRTKLFVEPNEPVFNNPYKVNGPDWGLGEYNF